MPQPTKLSVASGFASATGRRDDNQDYMAVCEPSGTLMDFRGVVAAVADGVSGANGGRVAAETTVRSFMDGYFGCPQPIEVSQAAGQALVAANHWIHAQGRKSGELKGMATTFSALILRHCEAWIVHVGDSRIYQLRDDVLTQLTTDHALSHPDMQHVLTRAIGFEPSVHVDMAKHGLRAHDRFFLCSDGIHASLRAEEIQDILAERRAPQATADHLIEEAIKGGSRDNVTAVVVDVLNLPPPEKRGLELAAARLPIVDLPQVGDVIDDFRLDRDLSDGRYSRLFVGVDLLGEINGGRDLALKFPHPRVTNDATYRSAFVREAWVAARVRSPFVAEVFELSGERQSRLYTVMPLYEGETLERRLQRRPPVALQEGIAIGLRLSKAVYAVHRMSVIHRDIKPENIILHDDNELKLLDLGVALLAGFPDFMPEDIPGTASYMAPELFTGAKGNERSDVFAVGVTLYRMFSGGRFPYGEIEPFMTPRFGRYTPLSRYRPDLPAWLDQVLSRATAVDPVDRFGDTIELEFELESALAHGGQVVKRFVPLIESNPVRLWQLLSLCLASALAAALSM